MHIWHETRHTDSMNGYHGKEKILIRKLISVILNEINYVLELELCLECFNISDNSGNPGLFQSLPVR